MRITERSMLARIRKARSILLVEPHYTKKYPPLGLAKIATYARERNIKLKFTRDFEEGRFDLICMTSLFTHDSNKVFKCIKRAEKRYPYIPIILGGVFASLCAKKIEEQFPNIHIFTGYSKTLDRCVPDYRIDWMIDEKWMDFCFVFITRGCPNKCPYCGVQTIEPEPWTNKDWKKHILSEKPNVMVSDNNLSSRSYKLLDDIVNHLVDNNKIVTFDNGFDVKHITPKIAKLLAKIKYAPAGLHLAFDRIEEDGVFQDAVKMLLDAGISKGSIMAYVLFNFHDKPGEANYRLRECAKLGIRPYPTQYVPLRKLERNPVFVGRYWTDTLRINFRFYWLMAGYFNSQPFHEWAKTKKVGKRNKMKKEDWTAWRRRWR